MSTEYIKPLVLPYSPDETFLELFQAFTAGPDSIGAHYTREMMQQTFADPLLVVTSTDLVLFPGGGRKPRFESYRNRNRGFIEMAAVSHVGAAVPWIIRQREIGDPNWRADALRFIDKLTAVRAVNSEVHWRDIVCVTAYTGFEDKVADLVDYTCAVTTAFLKTVLADERLMTFDYVREQYLDPTGSLEVPVPINDMMAATFGLAMLDSSYRFIDWLRSESLDWKRLMVILNGANGRLSGGLSVEKSNMYHLLWQVSGQRLSPEQFYIIPYARQLTLADLTDPIKVETTELEYRRIWQNLRANVELGRLMFEKYPAYQPKPRVASVLGPETKTVDQLPVISSPDDRRTVMTRLRVVMEDPTQLVSNAAADYVIDQLCANGNQPSKVAIPGFTNVSYPRRQVRDDRRAEAFK